MKNETSGEEWRKSSKFNNSKGLNKMQKGKFDAFNCVASFLVGILLVLLQFV